MIQNLRLAGFLFVLLISGCSPVTHKSGRSGELETLRTFALASGPLRVQWGVNVDSAAPYKKEFAFSAQTGKFRIVRLWFWWRWIEREQGKYDWSLMDEQVAWARRNGMEIMASFAMMPPWANGTDPNCDWSHRGDCEPPPKDPSLFPDFVSRAVRRYSKDIHYWNMWNEPNLPGSFSGTRDQFIGLIQEPGIRAAKAVDPTVKIVGPELAQLEPSLFKKLFGDSYFDWHDWARDLFRYNNGASYDVVSEHVYKKSAGDAAAAVDEFHDKMVEEHVDDKRVWLTETGFNSVDIGERQQGIETANLMTELEKRPWMERAFYFDIADSPDTLQSGDGLALCGKRPDLAPKLAFWLLTDRLADPGAPAPYEPNDPALVADFLGKFTRYVALDRSWDPSWDGMLNWYEWNFYYRRMTLGTGPDFDSLFRYVGGKSPGGRLSLDDWWAEGGDGVRLADEPINYAVPELMRISFRANVSKPGRAWFEIYGANMVAAPGERTVVHVNCGQLRQLDSSEFVEPVINSNGESQLNFFMTPGAARSRCLARVYFTHVDASGQHSWRSTELTDANGWFDLPGASEL